MPNKNSAPTAATVKGAKTTLHTEVITTGSKNQASFTSEQGQSSLDIKLGKLIIDFINECGSIGKAINCVTHTKMCRKFRKSKKAMLRLLRKLYRNPEMAMR